MKKAGGSSGTRRRKANRARPAKKSETLSDARLEREVIEQGKQIEELFESFAKLSVRRVRNAASLILLVAAGEPFCITPPSRYSILGASDECVKAAAAAMGVEAQEFVDIADGIVTRRRVDVDPIDIEELDLEVEYVVDLVTEALERLAPWECKVVQNYRGIMHAFRK